MIIYESLFAPYTNNEYNLWSMLMLFRTVISPEVVDDISINIISLEKMFFVSLLIILED